MATPKISHNGEFKDIQAVWVSRDGEFVEAKALAVSSAGQFVDASLTSDRVLCDLLQATPGKWGHAQVDVRWETTIDNFDADDKIEVRYERINAPNAPDSGSFQSSLTAGSGQFVAKYPNATYKISIYAVVDGVVKQLLSSQQQGRITLGAPIKPGEEPPVVTVPAVITYTTSGVPSALFPSTQSLSDRAHMSWTVPDFIDNQWLNPINVATGQESQTGWWIGLGSGPNTTQTYEVGLPQGTPWAYNLYSMRSGVRSLPVRLSNTTSRNYTPGVYKVPPTQRRTWVMGTKDVKKGFNHPDDTWLWQGDPGKWQPKYGVQIAAFFYWNSNAPGTNPFAAVHQQLVNGGRCVRLAIYLKRGNGGYDRALRFWTQSHGSKWESGNDLPLHNNRWLSPSALAANQEGWVDLDPVMAWNLTSTLGYGIALGNTNNAYDYFCDLYKHSSGELMFVVE